MQVNSNGIRIDAPRKAKKFKPLEYALDMMKFYRVYDGIECTIEVPKFSPLRHTLKEDGWKVKRNKGE